ncbi:methionyl-tRNA formyltransferase [Clostridium fallax]|uniref:Methionyl-tRNA formyltransferase n=1 Tax=Clostridium fallax TaxID=1533 RepID=A0A1M4UTY9_9CLOT|nr:methionyl-tRNA formyltransferase [Clostridium fallax]SHE60145.1 methionyl-tRNA formyltransferase [Clostridium fallax]SQB07304.1 methionyl-tRNA formyltransferase [Clostridium fallax]
MNIVFMGTPDFAVPSLKGLIEKFGVKAVFTQPDRPKGRGKKLAMSPVKEVALENNIPVYQPISIRKEPEVIEKLREMKPDFIIVVAFGQILPKEVLEIPKYACINLHASLLPKYRGAAPINWAIVNGEKVSGNTTMLMDVGLDTGDMLLKNQIEITDEMTAGELHDKLMESGSSLLVETIEKMVKGEITPIKQEDDKSCYASMINKDLAKINWKDDALTIHNLIRGFNPWPIAHTLYGDKAMKVYESEVANGKTDKEPGTILEVSKKGIEVATGSGILLIKKVQFPNGKPLTIEQYLNGNDMDKTIILGK